MKTSFPLYDLHLHRSAKQSIEDLVAKAKENNFKCFGVVHNVSQWGIQTDDDLRKYIQEVKDYPCFMGLQPAAPGWTKNLSKELIDQADYVLMDPQYMPNGNKYGDQMEVWDHNCYVDAPDDFMERHVEWYLKILNGTDEPLDVLGWPLFLPLSIQREYYNLWTQEHMEKIIEAARKRGIALEINDLARTPHAEFILMAKKAGVKLTFGSDTRDHRTFRLDYCKQIASLCGLTEDDFYIPVESVN